MNRDMIEGALQRARGEVERAHQEGRDARLSPFEVRASAQDMADIFAAALAFDIALEKLEQIAIHFALSNNTAGADLVEGWLEEIKIASVGLPPPD